MELGLLLRLEEKKYQFVESLRKLHENQVYYLYFQSTPHQQVNLSESDEVLSDILSDTHKKRYFEDPFDGRHFMQGKQPLSF